LSVLGPPEADYWQSQRIALQQATFEFSFSVGRLQTSLFKSTSPTAERALANAVLEGFGLTFDLRKYDMSVDLFLRAVTLSMVEDGEVRGPLLSSADDSGTDKDLKLLQVRYMRVQKDSPEFMTKHEGVDQSVDTELSTFKINIAPEPILSLYDFIMTTFVPQDDASPKQTNGDKAVSASGQFVKANAQEEAKSSDKIRVRVKVTSAQG
jgi:vacuolar protein sorting-associated protein 13A/C